MNTRLAPRETEYVHHVVEGESDKEIAIGMNITLNSVRSIAKRVRYKLKADNKTELAVNAIRDGIVSLCLIFCIAGGLVDGNADEMLRARTRTTTSARIVRMARGNKDAA